MKEINGQFIMDGCAPDDPNRLDTAEQLVALLQCKSIIINSAIKATPHNPPSASPGKFVL